MKYMLHAGAYMVVVRGEKHLRLVFEPAKGRTVQYPRFVTGKIQPERVAFHGESAAEGITALLRERGKLLFVRTEDFNDVEFCFQAFSP